MWPNQEVPHFQSTVVSFYQMVADLALRILTVVAVGLKLVCNQTMYFNNNCFMKVYQSIVIVIIKNDGDITRTSEYHHHTAH